jgi:N-acetylglucosamine kinase-like BadF-type ATPase
VVCGHGINCVGRTQDGRSLRFASLGDISGDWGGGQDVGMAALGAAVRARDGRGPRTKLEESVPRFFGLRRPASVSQAIQLGRIQRRRVGRLAPVVFEAAEAGDDVALAILDRLGDEVALMATAAIRRLHLARTDVHVVLGGGLFRRRNPRLFTRVRDGVVAVAPAADVRTLDAPPVVGAALLALRQVRAGESTARALRASLTEECLDQGAIA